MSCVVLDGIECVPRKVVGGYLLGKKYISFLILFISFPLFAQWPVVRSQSDWHSGAGLTDTTDQWGYRYFVGGGVNDATVPLMLLADPTSYDYTAWTPHVIDNSDEIGTFNWCVRPADIDGDGIIDIVANLEDTEAAMARVVWYRGPASGWTYTRSDIYTYTPISIVAGSFPADIDNDGDVDVVAADHSSLYWFENDGTGGGWTQHIIYSTTLDEYYAYYYDVADADGDGFLDVMVTEIEISYGVFSTNVYVYCTIYWNNGTAPDYFDSSVPGGYSLLHHFNYSVDALTGLADSTGNVWRAVFFDADPTDGLLDVSYEKSASYYDAFGLVYAAWDSVIVKTQSTPHNFVWQFGDGIDAYATNMGHDGLWNNDFDGDGDEDLVVAVADNDCASLFGCDNDGYFFLIQSDPGDVFSYHLIVYDPYSSYGDGAIMFDMDGDGMTDIVGTCDSLGYYRRTGTGYTDFVLYPIDNIPGTGYETHYASHWVYPYNMDRGICSGDADIDLIVVFDNQTEEGIIIYENQMFTYVTSGSLYSAILGIPLPADTCVACSVYWEGCEIPEYTIEVAGRVGESVSDCQSAGWGAISSDPYHDVPHGWRAGEIHTPVDTVWVQYFIRFTRSGGTVDLSPLIDSVWVKVFPIPCECEDIQAQWICPLPCFSFTSCSTQVMQVILWTDSTTIDTSQVYLTVNDGMSSYPLYEPTAYLSFTCLTPSCDSVFAEVSGIPWADASTITITLDSAYTSDGCLTIW